VDQFAVEHLAALAATAVVATFSIWEARARPGGWIVLFSRTLAVLMLAAYLAENVAIVVRGTWSLERNLPLQLTDVVTITAARARWSPRPLLFELAYFRALTASLQAVLTPNLDNTFPACSSSPTSEPTAVRWSRPSFSPGDVGLRLAAERSGGSSSPPPPSRSSPGSAICSRAAITCSCARSPRPPRCSTSLGPWPWYILSGAMLAIAMFAVLDVPFRGRRRALAQRAD
jgi:uncharacterized membrane protein YwaF